MAKEKGYVQTMPNIHKVLEALKALEETPTVKAYLALVASITTHKGTPNANQR